MVTVWRANTHTTFYFYIRKKAFQMMGRPKELCILFDTTGMTLQIPDIDSRRVCKISNRKFGAGNIFDDITGTYDIKQVTETEYQLIKQV